jgi:hypothetical protein
MLSAAASAAAPALVALAAMRRTVAHPATRRRPARRRTRVVAVLAGLAIGAAAAPACTTFRQTQPLVAAHAGVVRLRYAAPRGLVAVTRAGDTTMLADVTTIVGEVRAASDGMLELRALTAETAQGRALRRLQGSLATVWAPTAGATIERQQFSLGRTVAAVVLTAAAAVAVAGAIFLITFPDS